MQQLRLFELDRLCECGGKGCRLCANTGTVRLFAPGPDQVRATEQLERLMEHSRGQLKKIA